MARATMGYARQAVLWLITITIPLAWGCSGSRESGSEAPTVEESTSTSISEMAGAAAPPAGTYTLRRAEVENSCGESLVGEPGTISEETMTISQGDEGILQMTVAETAETFTGTVKGNSFTLVNTMTKDESECLLTIQNVFAGTRHDDGSLSGTIIHTQTGTHCDTIGDCERRETFTALVK